MEDYLTQITNYLLTQSWQIAFLVVVIAGVNLVLKNKSAHVRYLLWLIVLAKCLIPPLVNVPLAVLPQVKTPEPTLIPNAEIPATNVEMSDTVRPKPIALPSLPVTSPTIMERLAKVTAKQWLGFGWIVGVAAFVLFAVIKALRTNFWLWRQRRPLPAALQIGIEELFFGLGLKTFPKVWLVRGIGQPFVWGLLRGSIYLPADFVKLNNAEHRRGVLGHELGHILRFDAAVNILQIVAQAVFWFHPFVWWANKRIRAEREKCCDEMAIARLGAKAKDYSSAIVNILISEHESTRPVPSLAVAGPVKNIEERIKTMLRPGKKFYKHPSLIAATFVLLIAVLTVPTALVLTARAETKGGVSPLHQAAAKGDIEQVRSLISKGVDVNETDQTGQTALHLAARHGHKAVVELLLDRDADVHAQRKRWPQLGATPLHEAAKHGHKEIVEVLLANGSEVNERDGSRWTALHYAARNGHKEIVKVLLTNGADVNARDKASKTPVERAMEGNQREVVELLVAKGADISPLCLAAYTGDSARVKSLIQNGADVNIRTQAGITPLCYVAHQGSKDMVQLLVDNGADVNTKDNWNWTPLHSAAEKGHKDVAELLIEKGANVNARDGAGRTPLWYAEKEGHTKIVELLRKHGAKE
jgi:ankyrin repeat protein/beta-lactamase regulating signal transducer with metallopeptidase domain